MRNGIWVHIPLTTNTLGVRVFAALIVADFKVFIWVFFIYNTIIPLALVRYEVVIANSALRASLAIYVPSHIQLALVD